MTSQSGSGKTYITYLICGPGELVERFIWYHKICKTANCRVGLYPDSTALALGDSALFDDLASFDWASRARRP